MAALAYTTSWSQQLGISGGWLGLFLPLKNRDTGYVWYLVTVPSATNHLRKSCSTGPSSTLLPKDFLPMWKVVFETTFGWAGNSFPGQFHVIVPSGPIDAATVNCREFCQPPLRNKLRNCLNCHVLFIYHHQFPSTKNAWAASLRAKVAQVETSWSEKFRRWICVIIGAGHLSECIRCKNQLHLQVNRVKFK